MVNYIPTDPSALSDQEYYGSGFYNYSKFEDDISHYYNLMMYFENILLIFTILVSSVGILGNGKVIWLLGFHIKKNSFTTYILNLAIADLGFLTTLIFMAMTDLNPPTFFPIDILYILYNVPPQILLFQFSAGQYLLTVISMDRCVSVFFPIWHRCHRPTKLSPIICALIWVLSFLPSAICSIHFGIGNHYYVSLVQLTVNALLCLPLMVISSLMLFIKVCYKSKQRRRRKLLTTILITVAFFCCLSFPINIIYMIERFVHTEYIFHAIAMFCACLNSSVNPLIYYLVGKPRKDHSNKSMKAVLQKLFKEEEI